MDNFPGNSHTQKTPEPDPNPEDKNIRQVVTGKVIRRKKPLGQRMKETFFTGDSDSVIEYVIKEVIVPNIKMIVSDIVNQSISRAFYGENGMAGNRTFRPASPGSRQTHISYNQQYATRPGTSMSAPQQPMRRPTTQPSSMEIGAIILQTKVEADDILEQMYTLLDTYGSVSVAELYNMMKQTSQHTDHKYGWTNLQGTDLRRVREGWMILLPNPEDLRQ